MNNIAAVDRVGPVIPVLRREQTIPPAAGDLKERRESPPGKTPRERRRKRQPGAVTPVVAPHSTFGHIVDTFASPPSTHSAEMNIQ